MKAILFSSQREIREYLSTTKDGFIPKLYTIDDFLKRVITIPDRAFISGSIRVLYLYKAVSTIDIEKLGFSKGFASFLSDSQFIFRFFEEIYAEKKDISEDLSDTINALITVDTYEDYSIHLQLLAEIYQAYKTILEKEKLIDRITINNYRLSDYFLSQFTKIEVHIDGFLSRFELSIFEQLEDIVEFHLMATPFNKKLFDRLGLEDIPINRKIRYLLSDRESIEITPIRGLDRYNIEVIPIRERLEQVAWILSKIDEFVKRGATPSKIAVILPDESFVEYLKLFDTKRNFNYAMGEPFSQTQYYIKLQELYDYLTGKRDYLETKVKRSELFEEFEQIESFNDFISFIQSIDVSDREKKIIDETLFLFKRYEILLKDEKKLQILNSWLKELSTITIDDTSGGKITVMGLLESRGMKFDGVVIPDFNEGVVPHISDKDIFLNSHIRKMIEIPTRKDKENLQKHYYYSLLRDSKFVAISYVESETSTVSRFLKELGLGVDKNSKDYMNIIAPQKTLPPYPIDIRDSNIFLENPKLTPTKLKDSIECMRRVYWKYKIGIKVEDTQKSQNIGTVIHKALEIVAKNKAYINSEDDYFRYLLNEIYKELDISQKFSFAIDWEDNLKAFCQRDYENLKYSKQIKIEDWCSIRYSEYELSFKVDRVDLDEANNKIRLIDYKTGSNIDKKAKDESDFQLLFYQLWAEKHYPNYEIDVFYEDLKERKPVHINLDDKKEIFQIKLSELPSDKLIEYPMTTDTQVCKYCDYKISCGRDL